MRHLNNMAKVALATGMIVAYGYSMEAFFAYFSADKFERFMMWNRMTGPVRHILLVPDSVQHPDSRSRCGRRRFAPIPLILWFVSIVINIGMWLERFVIVITSLHRDFLPSSWGYYAPTIWDWAVFVGTLGLFMTCIFLFCRVLP